MISQKVSTGADVTDDELRENVNEMMNYLTCDREEEVDLDALRLMKDREE